MINWFFFSKQNILFWSKSVNFSDLKSSQNPELQQMKPYQLLTSKQRWLLIILPGLPHIMYKSKIQHQRSSSHLCLKWPVLDHLNWKNVCLHKQHYDQYNYHHQHSFSKQCWYLAHLYKHCSTEIWNILY